MRHAARTTNTPEGIKPLVDAIRGRFSPESIWLFGSRARGDNREDSDWDILVALPNDADENLLDPLVGWSIQREFGIPATVVFTLADDLEASWGSPNTLGYALARDGRRLDD
ncbi:nucleotidyltransferase domain-containing protein [Aminobacter sp. Piv2-1]|uniref:nucleotidyltransferase domain-containing protein n=1 Tax=unclassified Aminobacter TaxID=2644704 RepID=UPI0030B63E19